MLHYERLSEQTENQIKNDIANHTRPALAFDESKVIRRADRDAASVWRTAFIRDIDKIQHCLYYKRYADKTQVFSFYKNDDIPQRALHVQLVSRIARTTGKTLNLNLDLIEAIALGHDIGHTPFGHAREKYLDELLYAHTQDVISAIISIRFVCQIRYFLSISVCKRYLESQVTTVAGAFRVLPEHS